MSEQKMSKNCELFTNISKFVIYLLNDVLPEHEPSDSVKDVAHELLNAVINYTRLVKNYGSRNPSSYKAKPENPTVSLSALASNENSENIPNNNPVKDTKLNFLQKSISGSPRNYKPTPENQTVSTVESEQNPNKDLVKDTKLNFIQKNNSESPSSYKATTENPTGSLLAVVSNENSEHIPNKNPMKDAKLIFLQKSSSLSPRSYKAMTQNPTVSLPAVGSNENSENTTNKDIVKYANLTPTASPENPKVSVFTIGPSKNTENSTNEDIAKYATLTPKASPENPIVSVSMIGPSKKPENSTNKDPVTEKNLNLKSANPVSSEIQDLLFTDQNISCNTYQQNLYIEETFQKVLTISVNNSCEKLESVQEDEDILSNGNDRNSHENVISPKSKVIIRLAKVKEDYVDNLTDTSSKDYTVEDHYSDGCDSCQKVSSISDINAETVGNAINDPNDTVNISGALDEHYVPDSFDNLNLLLFKRLLKEVNYCWKCEINIEPFARFDNHVRQHFQGGLPESYILLDICSSCKFMVFIPKTRCTQIHAYHLEKHKTFRGKEFDSLGLVTPVDTNMLSPFNYYADKDLVHFILKKKFKADLQTMTPSFCFICLICKVYYGTPMEWSYHINEMNHLKTGSQDNIVSCNACSIVILGCHKNIIKKYLATGIHIINCTAMGVKTETK